MDQDTVFPITSDNAEITEAGDYCFGAAFSGDSDAGVPESRDDGTNECFTITPVSRRSTPWPARVRSTSVTR